MPIKRSVRRISPGRVDTFDDHLWPVVVALGVLSAIGFGAVVTLLSGPVMWLSLLALPALTAAAMHALSRMNDSLLRKTMQFALIVSLAAHLLILVVASLVLIFDSGTKTDWQQVTKREERKIEFSNRNKSASIPVTQQDNAPEPDVEIRRERTQVTSREQLLPVPQTTPTVSPQTRRRESLQQSIPRFDDSLSQLRRNRLMKEMKNSIAVKSSAAPPVETEQTRNKPASREVTEAIEASSADSISRSSARENPPRPTDAVAELATRAPSPQPSRKAASAASTAPQSQRQENSRLAQIPRPKSSDSAKSAHARVTRDQVKIRKQSAKTKSQPAPPKRIAKTNSELKPAESAGQLTRRPQLSSKTSTSDAPNPLTRSAESKTKVAKIQRRTSTPPSISNTQIPNPRPRLASNAAPTLQSVEPLMRPAANPQSTAKASSIEAKTLSITKGLSGIAGGIDKPNLQAGQGGLPSPAVRPSDAMLSRRQQSPDSNTQRLTNTQASRIRRSQAESPRPTSAFRADTVKVAKISGSKTPTIETKESSAAEITSASRESREAVAIEKGAAPINLGPTKVVAGVRRRKLSGGGSPEVANLSPAKTKRSDADSETRPSLANAPVAPTAAPREAASELAAAELEDPSELADLMQRSEGSDSQQLDQQAAPDVAATSNEGSSNAVQQLANRSEVAGESSRSRVEQILRDLELENELEDDDEEEKKRLLRMLGNLRERVAVAPNLDQEQAPSAGTNEELEVDEGAVAAAELASRLSSSRPFSSADLIGQSVARLAVEAVRSLPVAEGSLARRSATSESESESESGKRALQPATRPADREPTGAAPRVSSAVAIPKRSTGPERSATFEEAAAEPEIEIARSREEDLAAAGDFSFEVDAVDGPVGLSTTPAVSAGVNRRPASEQSTQLQPELDTRFRNEDFGGAPAMNPTAKISKEAFRQRTPGMAQRSGEPKTEVAINKGLEFLIRHQQPDGSWVLNRFDSEHPLHQRQLDSDMAATALAILSFQGAGYNHLEFKYARQVNHGIRWLVENQAEDGLLYLDSNTASDNACRLYSHGIAALALTEAYGMTQDPMLKEPAQKALDFIAESQHPSKGGWRYFAEMKKRSSDTSVSGWMVMALQSGRLSGLQVEDRTFDSLASWLAVAADPVNESLYRYNPYAVNSQGVSRINGRNASPSMTAVGLLMRIYTGWEHDDPRLISGANFLIDHQMPGETLPLRDTYYWYYATQVLKHVGGSQWQKWNDTLRPLLIRTQEKSGDNAGSWDPYAPVPDRWAPFGGRLYVTTMNLLSLEVRHRLLPLYKKTNAIEPSGNPVFTVDGPVE